MNICARETDCRYLHDSTCAGCTFISQKNHYQMYSKEARKKTVWWVRLRIMESHRRKVAPTRIIHRAWATEAKSYFPPSRMHITSSAFALGVS